MALKRLEIGKLTNMAPLENEIAMMTLSKHPNVGEIERKVAVRLLGCCGAVSAVCAT